MTKDSRIKIRLSHEEKEEIRKKGKAVGGMSALFRKSVDNAKLRDRKSEKELAILNCRLSANLNMIAKHANIYQSSADAVEIIASLISLEREIKNLINKMDGQ